MECSPSIIDSLKSYFSGKEKSYSILIVPGGGVFANHIRSVSKEYSLKDDSSHWMAILSMEQYAYYLIDKTGINSTDEIEDIPEGVSLLLPYALLKKTDVLPHSWDVTSDTIAAWIAREIGAVFIKVTDVDGIIYNDVVLEEISAEKLLKMGSTCIDTSLPRFLINNAMDCIIVSGMHPERVIDAVIGKNVAGTHIKGNI